MTRHQIHELGSMPFTLQGQETHYSMSSTHLDHHHASYNFVLAIFFCKSYNVFLDKKELVCNDHNL